MQFDTIDSATDAQGRLYGLAEPARETQCPICTDDRRADRNGREICATGSARVVVLAARGKSFCAGGDLQWMQVQMQADRATRQAGARGVLRGCCRSWNTLPQPVIGRIHGNAFGGGVGLASICDRGHWG